MTEHIIFLNNVEAAAPDLRLIVRPVRPQPPRIDGLYFRHIGLGRWRSYLPDGSPAVIGCVTTPLGSVGDVLLGKEAWADDWEHNRVFYRAEADGDGHIPCESSGAGGLGGGGGYARVDKWRSPATMPRWAVRWRRTVVEVGVMRVGEITTEQAVMAGFQDTQGRPWWPRTEFRKNWERRWKQAGNPWCEPGSWAWWAMVEEGHHA